MAVRRWLDASGDFTATANWTTATVPIAGDQVEVLNGTQNIVTNVPAVGVDYGTTSLIGLSVGPNFRGKIADSVNDFALGSIDHVSFDGAQCQEAWFSVDN